MPLDSDSRVAASTARRGSNWLFWSITLPRRMVGGLTTWSKRSKEVLRLYTIRTRRPHGFCSAAENEIVDRRSMSCRCSILHRSSQCPQRGIRLRHKCLEYVLRPSMTEEWRALSRKEWHHLDAVAQQRRSAKGSEQS